MSQLALSFTPDQQARNEELKSTIAQRMRGFVEIGDCLMEIRDNRFYRIDGYETFEQYCKEYWHFSDVRARQFISAAKVHANLKAAGIEELPEREYQVRSIVSLPPDQQVETWQAALKEKPTSNRITGNDVKRRAVEKQYKLEPGKPAIISSPIHPLNGETVTVQAIRGEIVEVETSKGKETLISPELQPITPLDLLKEENGRLKAAIAELVKSYPEITTEQIEGLKVFIKDVK